MAGPTDYDTIASEYAAGIDSRPWNVLYERPAMLALLPDVDGKDVLDAGCGPGWYADWLARRGARVVGVDRSVRMVALAREHLGDRARIIAGDLGDLRRALPDHSFDIVLSSLVLHYLATLTEVFGEWARLLRPGGVAVFSTLHPVQPASVLDPGYLCAELIEERWDWIGEHMRYYRRPLRDLTEPLAAAGFLIERMVEPNPGEALRTQDPRGYERLRRLPAFLFVRARKPSG